ncbi:hypothetical protein NSK_005359 [Nannochloropsis salina CCMP1776]|uniref:Uncharacterized protein n=1 Tax=Nannochloropsis salina CCMP1776 TaxID=1027361 RepID=A0A4D9D1B1_9STRA|nr:hypothetical protein NSK_005359 [Nannochloropsis salina CCMP1776]|eukprot:TFJ83295.1 hypothetical protein NSK_005359 [Nannochloropsis salina CCMP1776]
MGLDPSQRSSRRGKGDKSSQETSRRPVNKRPRRLVSTKRVKEVKMGACADPKKDKIARKMTIHFEIERDENEKEKEDGDGMQAEANKEKCQKGGGDKCDAKQEETGWQGERKHRSDDQKSPKFRKCDETEEMVKEEDIREKDGREAMLVYRCQVIGQERDYLKEMLTKVQRRALALEEEVEALKGPGRAGRRAGCRGGGRETRGKEGDEEVKWAGAWRVGPRARWNEEGKGRGKGKRGGEGEWLGAGTDGLRCPASSPALPLSLPPSSPRFLPPPLSPRLPSKACPWQEVARLQLALQQQQQQAEQHRQLLLSLSQQAEDYRQFARALLEVQEERAGGAGKGRVKQGPHSESRKAALPPSFSSSSFRPLGTVAPPSTVPSPPFFSPFSPEMAACFSSPHSPFPFPLASSPSFPSWPLFSPGLGVGIAFEDEGEVEVKAGGQTPRKEKSQPVGAEEDKLDGGARVREQREGGEKKGKEIREGGGGGEEGKEGKGEGPSCAAGTPSHP